MNPLRARRWHSSRAWALASAAIAAFSLAATAADIEGFVYPCEQGKLCYWHKAVLAPPHGWIEDKAWTQRYKAMMMFPGGDKSRSNPVMYVRAHHGDKDLSIEDYISGAQERWKAKLPDSTIEPLPDVARPGKPTIKVFLYKNPSQSDQAFELTAFLKDVDVANPQNTFFFQTVLSAPSKAQLDKARAAFFDVLARL